MSINGLKKIAAQVRKDIIQMSLRAKSAHTGGALSCVEILVSLYFQLMKVYPKDPYNDKRDRLVLARPTMQKFYTRFWENGDFLTKRF